MIRQFNFQKTMIPGLIEITPFYATDVRGSLLKDFSEEIFAGNGISCEWVEELFITSRKGVLRGLHFQRVKQITKLIRCASGHIWNVVIDLRRNSPTFKKWQSFELAEGGTELLIPGGCAAGNIALMDSSIVCKCSEKFYAEYDDGIRWDDPDLGIEWPLKRVDGIDQAILSEKDKNLQSFAQFIADYHSL